MASSNAMKKMREIAEAVTDPVKVLQKALGKHASKVYHAKVLGAHYIRPAKTRGGIFMPDKKIEEDRHQGNIYLVVAKGKGAFKDDGIAKFNGDALEVGDWFMAIPGDGVALFINEVPCRIFDDTRILMKVTDPEIYY